MLKFHKEVRPLMCETTALGVAIAAGCAEGIRKWDLRLDATVPRDTFVPSITENGKDLLTLCSIELFVKINTKV